MLALAAQPGSRQCFSVLLAEDEFLVAMDVEDMLERNGHRVVGPASSVDQALRLLEHERPDVGVLDVNLRGRLVVPVARRLEELNIPFVLISAYASFDFDGSHILDRARNVGKPISEDRLIDAMIRAVGST